ncbi:MAG: hypothetical protein ABSG25_07610 [Bryobacteraceae bacterium]
MQDMGLDATVYCNCYELGKVHTPPPQPDLIYIDDKTGQLKLRWDAPGADQHQFYEWLASACEHGPLGEFVTHRFGNVARIGFLRQLFARTPQRFPILLSKVLYNGTHAGDVLNLADIEELAIEMASVRNIHCADAGEEEMLRQFETQMMDLIRGARSVGKPIIF